MKRTKLMLIIISVIFISSLLLCFWMMRPAKENTVEIVQDGIVLYRFDLDTAENQQLVINYAGKTNTVLIEDGKICITDADCPDHTCVHMGWLQTEAMPIICLPNRLVIQFAQSGEAYADA